jgi:hypothetical protein
MCSICGRPDYVRCDCQSAQPFCDQCAEDSVCLDKLDSACLIYHFGNPALPTRLINLDLPNGSSAQTIFEAIDAALGRSGSGPLSSTDTNAIHLLLDGPGNRHITATLILSAQSGNTAVINSDGLFVPLPNNLYKVQVDGSHIPYYLEDALIGGTDGIVSLSFEPSNGILFGLPSINMTAVVDAITGNQALIDSLSGSILNDLLNNPSYFSQLLGAIETGILNDPNFITALTQAILNNPAAKALLCSELEACLNPTGSTCNAPIITDATTMISSTGGTVVLTITYTDASPLPDDGYLVFYRKFGSLGAYTSAGPFPNSSSPIIIPGLSPSDYEGYVESDCDGSFSSGATFVTNDYYNVDITNDLPNLVITNVTGIGGFTFSGPVPVGGRDTGVHTAFTAIIQVTTTGIAAITGNLALVRNGIVIDCINIPSSTTPGVLTFTSQTFVGTDLIQIELNTGTC